MGRIETPAPWESPEEDVASFLKGQNGHILSSFGGLLNKVV